MQVITLPCGPIEANSYIVYSDTPQKNAEGKTCAVVIDPADGKLIVGELEGRGLACTHIFLTHGHFDHIAGLYELKKSVNAPVYIHPLDASMTESGTESLAVYSGIKQGAVKAEHLVKDGELIDAAGLTFRVMHTPGHTPGGVTYVVEGENAAFCGDSVFCESFGRTDFPGGSLKELTDSVINKILKLKPETRLYTGHMMSTSVGYELKNNPIFYYRRQPW